MKNEKFGKIIKISGALLGATFVGLSAVAKAKKKDYIFDNKPEEKNSFEGKKVVFIENKSEKENADGKCGHLEAVDNSHCQPTFYNKYVKRAIDIAVSFGGLVVLSPVYTAITLAIKADDPGPVLFTQKRVGQDKRYFKLHKFRSMKMSTPSDIPTHQLSNPEQYITKVGKFIRKHSLDELPQIWDIFVGNMSIVGPRPALWNQDFLTAERDKYNANDIKPGLTGWAQINGRDELEIPVKAKLDGEYVKKESLLFDTRCFLGTIAKLDHDDSVVEGGTGELARQNTDLEKVQDREKLIGKIGFGEKVEVNKALKKRVLITGANSYIGDSFYSYAKKHYSDNFSIDILDMLDVSWKDRDFSKYDVVLHVAGIAHADVGQVDENTKKKYYRVNTDLATEVCRKAKADGVKQFIFMSSMIVYGDSAPYGVTKIIKEDTIPVPANFYGDSKWQADIAIRALADDEFKVVVIRSPMLYGKNCKGNYPTLAKIAKSLPVFPYVENMRSMIYVDNLCELFCQVMLLNSYKRNAVVLTPQNKEWTNTSKLAKIISTFSNHSIKYTKCIKPFVRMGSVMPGKIGALTNKAFGNSCYSHKMSVYDGINYQLVSLEESIKRTESIETEKLSETEKLPLVSVITVSYNSEKTISRTIEAVLNQTYKNIEYIIVDGLSTDNTVKIAHKYEENFQAKGMKYTVISEKDKGIYDAMNKGIYMSSGDIIGIINADDWYEKDAIENMVKKYINTGFDYYYADINIIKQDGSKIVKHAHNDILANSHHWNHPSCFVRRKLYDEIGVFRSEGIHDDFDFFLRVRQAKKKIVVDNKIIANFTAGGVSNNKKLDSCKKRFYDRYRCYENNGYSPLYKIECFAIEAVKYLLG